MRRLRAYGLLAAIVCCLFLAMVAPASAQMPQIGLTLGGVGASLFNIGDIKPGMTSNATVNLTNVGLLDGTVYIWADNITEIDRFGSPTTSFSQYLYFDVQSPGLSSTIALPATIRNYPGNPLLPNAITVPLRSGQTIQLNWTCRFIDTGVPQNEAQGCDLSFTIYYSLIGGVPTPTPPPQPSPPTPTITITPTATPIPSISPSPSPTPIPLFDSIVVYFTRPFIPQEQTPPDHRLFMVSGFLLLTLAFVDNSYRGRSSQKHRLDRLLWWLGTLLITAGIFYQLLIIFFIGQEPMTIIHPIIGAVATLVVFAGFIAYRWLAIGGQKKRYVYNSLLAIAVVLAFLTIILALKFLGII